MNLITRLFGVNWYYVMTQEEQDKVNKTNYYSMRVECKNCGNQLSLYVKKGIYLKTIITEIKCKSCECKLEKI